MPDKVLKSRGDRRDLSSYTPQEVAHHLSVPLSTVRAWSVGQKYRGRHGEKRDFERLIVPAETSPLSLSFWNLAELYVLASLRRHHEVPMHNVRAALLYSARKLSSKRPLIDEVFYTDGVSIFVEKYAKLIDASNDGQAAIKAVLKDSLARVERGVDGHVIRLFPWLQDPKEPHHVEINSERGFGRLVLAGTNIPTEVIAQRFNGGEDIDVLAADYDLSEKQIQYALRWERCAPQAA